MLHCGTDLKFYNGERDYTVVDLGITNGELQDSACEAEHSPAMPVPSKRDMHIGCS